jgi:hypothetical protein
MPTINPVYSVPESAIIARGQKKIGDYTIGHLLKTAETIVNKKTLNSSVLDDQAEARIPRFDADGTYKINDFFQRVGPGCTLMGIIFAETKTGDSGRLISRLFCKSEVLSFYITFTNPKLTYLCTPSHMYLYTELTLGRVLGRGGFCVVNEISNVALKSADTTTVADGANNNNDANNSQNVLPDEDFIHNIVQDRTFMQKYCIRNHKDARYAIKKLQPSVARDPNMFVNGIVDLAVEARFLSVIRHPNIIKMRAVASGSPYDTTFFVVLDRLYDILGTRIVKWKKQKLVGVKKWMDRKGKKEMAFWVERLSVAYDLACAIKYLHDLQ